MKREDDGEGGGRDAPRSLGPLPFSWQRGACPASVSSRVSPVFLHSSPACEKPVFSLMRVLGTEMLVWETEWRTTGGLTPVTLFPATATSRGTSMSRREAHSTSPGTWTWSRFCDPAGRGRGLRGGDPRGILGREDSRGSLCQAPRPRPGLPPHPRAQPEASPQVPCSAGWSRLGWGPRSVRTLCPRRGSFFSCPRVAAPMS